MEPLKRDSKDVVAFEGGSLRERVPGRGVYSCMPACSLRRLAQHYEYGKIKYGHGGEAYKDGLPVKDCMDSMFRHMVSYLDGDNSEDHMAAVAWGAFAIMYMEEHKSRFQDIAGRKRLSVQRGDFNYIQKRLEEKKLI